MDPTKNEVLQEEDEETTKNNIKSDCSTNVEQPSIMNMETEQSVQKMFDVSNEMMNNIKKIVNKSQEESKIFSMHGWYPTIVKALKKRGWIEKMNRQTQVALKNCIQAKLKYSKTYSKDFQDSELSGGQDTIDLLSSIAIHTRKIPPNLIWFINNMGIDWQKIPSGQIVNKLPNISFTTKIGLCNCFSQIHWYSEFGSAMKFFPRCYVITSKDGLKNFIEDFQLNACFSLLKWLLEKSMEPQGVPMKKEPYYLSDFQRRKRASTLKGGVHRIIIDFAMARSLEFVCKQQHRNINLQVYDIAVPEEKWTEFIRCYNMLIHKDCVIEYMMPTDLKDLIQAVKDVMAKVKPYWPQHNLDGFRNVWIIKPAAQSRGHGITLINKVHQVQKFSQRKIKQDHQYVIQKYIEKPFLIYDTKFDIRQWFLVTNFNHLTIWMYRNSYLRFCSQPFSLINFHESIHLSNNAVQRHYKKVKQNKLLPEGNMWDSRTFQIHLQKGGFHDAWQKIIYPGMCKAIVAVVLASQRTEKPISRKNCFELFGADFMITEDFQPWLIEINACPCMSPTTKVTRKLCPECLEDVVKVMFDTSNNVRDVGMFEMVYLQSRSEGPVKSFIRPEVIAKTNPCDSHFLPKASVHWYTEPPKPIQKHTKSTLELSKPFLDTPKPCAGFRRLPHYPFKPLQKPVKSYQGLFKPFLETSKTCARFHKPPQWLSKPVQEPAKPSQGLFKPSMDNPKPSMGFYKPSQCPPKPVQVPTKPSQGLFKPPMNTPKPSVGFHKPPQCLLKPVQAPVKPSQGLFKPPVDTPKPSVRFHKPPQCLPKPVQAPAKPSQGLLKPPMDTPKPSVGFYKPPQWPPKPVQAPAKPSQGLFKPPMNTSKPSVGFPKPPQCPPKPVQAPAKPSQGIPEQFQDTPKPNAVLHKPPRYAPKPLREPLKKAMGVVKKVKDTLMETQGKLTTSEAPTTQQFVPLSRSFNLLYKKPGPQNILSFSLMRIPPGYRPEYLTPTTSETTGEESTVKKLPSYIPLSSGITPQATTQPQGRLDPKRTQSLKIRGSNNPRKPQLMAKSKNKKPF